MVSTGSHQLEASQCWADWDDEQGFEDGANQILQVFTFSHNLSESFNSLCFAQQSPTVALTEPSSHLQPIGSWSSPWSTCPRPLRPGRQRPRHHGARDPRRAGQGAAGGGFPHSSFKIDPARWTQSWVRWLSTTLTGLARGCVQ